MEEQELESGGKRAFPASLRKWWYILFILFTVLLLVSTAGFGWTLWESRKENADFEKLAALADAGASAAVEEEPGQKANQEEPEGEPARTHNYQDLYRMNPDFVGWLCIEGTKVDYPVMHTPEDSQYYIYRDFYGKKTASGTPFMGGECTTESDSIILYGHNMKNGTMFGTLDEYRDKSYWKEHPVIRFDTLEEDREYEIFSVFTTRLLYENEEGFRYYGYVGDLTEGKFAEFVEQAKAASHYDTGITPEYGDQLLMLSTCSYHTENGRLVVAARRVREEE